jgi:hypothetical protein
LEALKLDINLYEAGDAVQSLFYSPSHFISEGYSSPSCPSLSTESSGMQRAQKGLISIAVVVATSGGLACHAARNRHDFERAYIGKPLYLTPLAIIFLVASLGFA